MATLNQLLGFPAVRKVVSRFRTPRERLQEFFNVRIGTENTTTKPDRTGVYDIFDITRQVATVRAPGSPAARRAPQVVGQVPFHIIRAHEATRLHYEKIYQNRPIGGQYGEVDPLGERYIARQVTHQTQKFRNLREFVLAMMLTKGKIYIYVDGDDWIPSGSATNGDQIPVFTIDFGLDPVTQISTNLWGTAATDIIDQIGTLNAEFEENHGFPLEHVWTDWTVWRQVLNNTDIQNIGGSSMTTFERFERKPSDAEGGDTGFTAVLRAIPWLTWHIVDYGLTDPLTGSFTKFFDGKHAVFVPTPSSEWFEVLTCGEAVQEGGPTSPPSLREAYYTWPKYCDDPAVVEHFALDNFLFVPYIPKAIQTRKVLA